MDPADLAIRNATYRRFVELGRGPTIDEVATAAGQGSEAVAAAWRRLHDAHAVVLADPAAPTPVLRMANPFSAVETPHRVNAAGRSWFANCGWDAFGVGVVLRSDSTIHTTCPDCREPLEIEVRDYRPADPSPVWHVLVPARDWWADIGFT
jgi:hypothetical protein